MVFRLFLLTIWSLAIVWPSAVEAACSNNEDGNPGQAGDFEYFDPGGYQFCNGEEWIDVPVSINTAACVLADDRAINYIAATDSLAFCVGAAGIHINLSAVSVVRTDGCGGAAEGSLNWDPVALHYFVCNGTGWVPLGLTSDATGYWAFDDGAGTTALDSFQTNNGTLTNMDAATDWVAGQVGNALDFDGSDDYVDVGNIPEIGGASELTFMAWFKIDDLNRDHDIITKGAHGGFVPILVFRDDVSGANTNFMTAIMYDGTDQVRLSSPSGSLNDTNWHHVAITFKNIDATGANMYLDGVLVDTKSTSLVNFIQNTADSVRIGGATPFNASVAMDGQIDDVRIYERELTADEIMAIYTATGGT